MISSITVEDRKRVIVPWWPEVEALKRRKKIEFKPGLNIIFGPNGSGKSTILTSLARTFHCEQAGIPMVTQSSITAHFSNMFSSKSILSGLKIEHDGQPVVYFGAESSPGLKGGAFDNDFFTEGVLSLTSRGSSGQLLESRLGRILKAAETVEEVQYKVKHKNVNDVWGRMLDQATVCMKPNIPKGQRTILLDEPDRSLAIPLQTVIFQLLTNGARHFQIIVATHSIFAVNLDAHYIELKRGYLKECREAMAEAL